MINLIIVGIGDLATKIIPAVKKLEDRKQIKNLIFVDTKPVIYNQKKSETDEMIININL
jgi:hypothetical protein